MCEEKKKVLNICLICEVTLEFSWSKREFADGPFHAASTVGFLQEEMSSSGSYIQPNTSFKCNAIYYAMIVSPLVWWAVSMDSGPTGLSGFGEVSGEC